MNTTYFSFLLTILAGLSTMIGCIFIFMRKANYHKIIVSGLSFAAGVMVATSITDLIPESLFLIRTNISSLNAILLSLLGMLLGIILSMIIDYYIPDTPSTDDNKNLFRVGLISMIAIILHNIPEGIATFIATNSNATLGISLALAIAIHNIPEGISISLPIYYSSGKRSMALLYTFISAISEPFGAIIAYFFLKNIMSDIILGILFSIIAGIMLEISFRTLLPSTKKYNNMKRTIFFFIIGMLFMTIKYFF